MIFFQSRSVRFQRVNNDIFAEKLVFIDSRTDEILAESLIIHYRDNIKHVADVVGALKEGNLLGFSVEGLCRYKVKKLLVVVAFGFQPSKHWDGRDEAHGGYIIVAIPGNAVVYHAYNRDLPEDYLLDSTYFERGDRPLGTTLRASIHQARLRS